MHGYVTIMRLPSDCGMACINPVLALRELHITHSAANAMLSVPVLEGKKSTIALYPTMGSRA